MVGLLYAVISLAALACGFMYPTCLSGACGQIYGLFGRSWFLWGAFYYALSAVLCLTNVRKSYVLVFLAGGTTFHAALIGYGYLVSGSICPLCWKFAILDIMLPVLYLLAPGAGLKTQIIRLPARVLPLVMAAILLINPVPGIGESSVATQSDLPAATESETSDPAQEHIITVLTAQGQAAQLDIRQKPALFFAVWCPHCDDALREIAALPRQERPDIVVTYLNQGDPAGVPKKLAQNGLAGEKYYLNEMPPAWLNMVPTLARWDSGANTIEIIEGGVR